MSARKIRIAIVQSRDGNVTCVGPDDFQKAEFNDAMDAAISYSLEAGHLVATRHWATVEIPEPSDVPVVEGEMEDAE